MNEPMHDAGMPEASRVENLPDAQYLKAALQEFRQLRGFRQRQTERPDTALSAGELDALHAVGLTDDEANRRDAERGRREALDAFFRCYSTALSTVEVARMLDVDPSRVRQRVKQRMLIPLGQGVDQRFPAAWFEDGREVPGLRRVLPELPADIRALEALSWWVTPTIELAGGDGRARSPRDCLLETGEVDRVIALARTLTRGEAA